MPPRLNVFSLARSIPFRPKPQLQCRVQPATRAVPSQCRAYSGSEDASQKGRLGEDHTQTLPHVSEEAAKTAEIMGEKGPEVQEQGTPVEEVGRTSQ